MLARLKTRLKAIHSDQRGLEALQVVIIVAIAAIILAAIFFFWSKVDTGGDGKGVKGWVTNQLKIVFAWNATDVQNNGDVK